MNEKLRQDMFAVGGKISIDAGNTVIYKPFKTVLHDYAKYLETLNLTYNEALILAYTNISLEAGRVYFERWFKNHYEFHGYIVFNYPREIPQIEHLVKGFNI